MVDPYDCKYIWGHREFEEEMKRQRDKLKRIRGIDLNISTLTLQLAEDFKLGKIDLDPKVIRFRKRRLVEINGSKFKV